MLKCQIDILTIFQHILVIRPAGAQNWSISSMVSQCQRLNSYFAFYLPYFYMYCSYITPWCTQFAKIKVTHARLAKVEGQIDLFDHISTFIGHTPPHQTPVARFVKGQRSRSNGFFNHISIYIDHMTPWCKVKVI